MPYSDPEARRECKSRWFHNNKGKAADSQRRYHARNRPVITARRRKKRYGLTPEECDALSAKQNHRCAICALPAAENKHGILCVDHDHETGKVRGMLCFNCNFSLGGFKDNPDFLRMAISYLKAHP